MKQLARFLFEAGMLKKMRRTGYPFLGSGGESVADHCFRGALLGWSLAHLEPRADATRVALMMLTHDLAEARTGDLNYVHKQYSAPDEERALSDAVQGLPQGLAGEITELVAEFNAAQTLEARLAHDADQIDLILELKEQQDLGNPYARKWLYYAEKRLRTKTGKKLAREIMATDWTDWWFEKRDELWIGPNNDT